MLHDQIGDAMREVRSIADSMEEGSIEWRLMHEAHSAMRLAGSLVDMVNSIKFAQLLDKNGD